MKIELVESNTEYTTSTVDEKEYTLYISEKLITSILQPRTHR
jgi:hypothetical protein